MDERKQLIEENKEIVKGLIIERKKLTIQLDQVSYLIQGYENTIKIRPSAFFISSRCFLKISLLQPIESK